MPVKKFSLAPNDLVLHLNEKAKKFNISKYEDFLVELCGEWNFQKEAIRKTLRYYLSGEYNNTKELFEENYENNPKMQDFAEKRSFIKVLPFPSKLACTIDLATGTGKTWVMYAVARIMLAEGMIDRVLILCPSKTIKREIYNKFRKFTENIGLTDSLPKDAFIKVPGIKESNETIETGDICIDNVHKTYAHVSSSISDSLKGRGQRTLVINDEAHHLLNPNRSNKETMLEWKNFLDDENYGFKYVLSLSGTPYKGNNYFNDVIYRFSIRDAINNKFVKNINYLTKDETTNQKQKWKAVFNNHEKLKKEYPKARKHITLVVTNSVKNANKTVENLKNFLSENTELDDDVIERKVIAVTSSREHDKNREILKTVDQSNNPVEWIVSVNMLTEGWDVSNIFQIYPHEKRAFNSKLLISQVLGRGLRIPKEYGNLDVQPNVWIYNHSSWSEKIDNLVREVAEITNVIKSKVIEDSKYNFNLHKINIDKKIENEPVKKVTNPKTPEKLGFHSTANEKEQTFENVMTHKLKIRKTDVSNQIKKYSLEEATNEIFTNLYLFDMEKDTDITNRISKDYIRNLIRRELNKINENYVSEENLQRGKSAFNVLLRQFTGTTKIEDFYGSIKTINTSQMENSSISESSFKNNGGLFTSETNFNNLNKEDKEIIERISKELEETMQTNLAGETYIRARIINKLKDDEYKSPLNLTLVSYKPERNFAETLVRKYSKYIDSWIKSRDRGFYSVPYIHRPGTHSLQKDFNPDFFIKKGDRIIVVEIKHSEDSSSIKNKDKLEGAKSYFNKLNERLENDVKYEFYFLDPTDYTNFFNKVILKEEIFVGKLQAELESKSRKELKGEE